MDAPFNRMFTLVKIDALVAIVFVSTKYQTHIKTI